MDWSCLIQWIYIPPEKSLYFSKIGEIELFKARVNTRRIVFSHMSLIPMWYNERLNWHIFQTFRFFFKAILIPDRIKALYRVKNSSNGNWSKKKGEGSLKQQATCWFQFQQHTHFVKEMRHQTDRLIKINNWSYSKTGFVFSLLAHSINNILIV